MDAVAERPHSRKAGVQSHDIRSKVSRDTLERICRDWTQRRLGWGAPAYLF